MVKTHLHGRREAFGRRRLADIVDRLTNGFVGPTRGIYVELGLPYLLARHVRDGQLSFDGQTFINADFNERNKKSKLKAGDVLLVQSGHIGHSAVVGVDHEGHNCHAMIVLSPTSGLRQSFAAMRSGSTVPHLTCTAVREIMVPMPAVAEQRRIVAILDDASDGIATAKANAERNLQNARELYERQLDFLFSSASARWPERALEQVADIINGYAFKSTDFQIAPGVRSIKITNVGVREFVADAGSHLPARFAHKYEGVAVAKGSIVVALTRTIIAGGLKVAVVPAEFHGALLNQRVAAIQPRPSELETAFLYAYLSTRRVMDHVKSRVNTLMQPNLPIADLRQLPLPVPAMSEQRELLALLTRYGEQSQKLESAYRRKLAALDELKNSLLHQVFSGGLSP